MEPISFDISSPITVSVEAVSCEEFHRCEPAAPEDTTGSTRNYYEDDGSPSSDILFDLEHLDIRSIVHESTHAVLFVFQNLEVDLSTEEDEEIFVQTVEDTANRIVCTFEAKLGRSLPWRVI